MKQILSMVAIAILVGALGCNNASEPGSGTGELKVVLTDAPAAYDAVNIVVSSVSVHMSGGDEQSGWSTINDVAATHDLLQLRNGVTAVLGTSELPAANYTQIRLMIGSGSNVVVDGVTYPLEIPSGMQTGVKLIHSFTIEEDRVYELTLDFDADKSVRMQGMGSYRLQPTIRLISTVVSGTISGIVQPDSARGVIYAISGSDTIATAYADTTTGAFRLMALPEGLYTVSVEASVGTYQPSSQSAVAVIRQQNTDIGTVTLVQ